MIYLKLSGGLGNQMFEYAMGRNLSLLRNDELKIDIEDFGKIKDETKRDYELDIFDIKAKICTNREVAKYKYGYMQRRILSRLFTNVGGYVFQRENGFSEKYLQIKGSVYLAKLPTS